jgi:hypothetical protein
VLENEADNVLQREQESEQRVDLYEGVPQVVRDALKQLNERYDAVSQIEERLKQAERRVGGIDNRLRDFKTAKPLTKEEVIKGLKENKVWRELEEDFPTHAEALALAVASRGDSGIGLDEIESVREKLQTDFESKLSQAQMGFELKLLRSHHPDHASAILEPEFEPWLEKQDAATQARYGSMDALDAIYLLNQYKKSKTAPRDIVQERQERLALSANVPGGTKPSKQKSEADMSDDEYRRHYAKTLWGKKK